MYAYRNRNLYLDTGFYPPPLPYSSRRSSLVPPPLASTGHQTCGWNINYATAFLIDHLQKQKDHGYKLRICYNVPRTENDSYRNVQYLFKSLNEFFFNGKLREFNSGVTFNWAEIPSRVGRRGTYRPGETRVTKDQILICLECPCQDPRDESRRVASDLLHQMIHAYFLITCEPPPEDEIGVDYRLQHGLHFHAVLKALWELLHVTPFLPEFRLSKTMLNPRPAPHPALTMLEDGMSRLSLGSRAGYLNDYSLPVSRIRPGFSACNYPCGLVSMPDVDRLVEEECMPTLAGPEFAHGDNIHYFEDDGSLTEGPRPQGPDAPRYSELIHDGRAIFLPRDKAEEYGSLAEKLSDNARYLEIPDCVPLPTVKLMFDFIATGSYGADLSKSHEIGGEGPPVIRESKPVGDWPDYLATDTQVFKLAHRLGFEELKNAALDRLNGQHVTYEDPTEVLEEIYHADKSYEDDKTAVSEELRNWVKTWLARRDPLYLLEFGEYSKDPCYGTNLEMVRSSRAWSMRIEQLLSVGGPFVEDVKHVYEKLAYGDLPLTHRDRGLGLLPLGRPLGLREYDKRCLDDVRLAKLRRDYPRRGLADHSAFCDCRECWDIRFFGRSSLDDVYGLDYP